jgi:hypothetical protein
MREGRLGYMNALVQEGFLPTFIRRNEIDYRPLKISVKESYAPACGDDIVVDKRNNSFW